MASVTSMGSFREEQRDRTPGACERQDLRVASSARRSAMAWDG